MATIVFQLLLLILIITLEQRDAAKILLRRQGLERLGF